MTQIDENGVPCRMSWVKQHEAGGELLLYRDKRQPGLTLNPSARAIWELCDGRRSILAISDELGKRLSCPGEALLSDVGETVAQLAGARMLSVVSAAAAPAPQKTGPEKTAPKTVADFGQLDWSRLASPQDDHYDVKAALALLAERTRAGRWPHQRPELPGVPRIAGGKVMVRHVYRRTRSNLVNAPLDHPNIGLAMDYLRRWPLGYQHFQQLIHSLHPLIDPDQEQDSRVLLRHSYSHSAEGRWGTLWSTINCPLMLAENSIHEMAHQKLFALGVFKESCVRLVANAPDEMFVSPVITDRLRPMTAVLHGVYAFLYVVALDLHILAAETDAEVLPRMINRLTGNVKKLEKGLPEVRDNIRVDAEGEGFVDGLYRWAEALIREGNEAAGKREKSS